MNIIAYYSRPKDNTSYILYETKDGRKFLTNGICIWSKDLKSKISQLVKGHADVKKVINNLKKYQIHADITKYILSH